MHSLIIKNNTDYRPIFFIIISLYYIYPYLSLLVMVTKGEQSCTKIEMELLQYIILQYVIFYYTLDLVNS